MIECEVGFGSLHNMKMKSVFFLEKKPRKSKDVHEMRSRRMQQICRSVVWAAGKLDVSSPSVC